MIALSIRQPWAWLIVNGFKDIENRTWKYHPKHRGPLLIHASAGMTKDECSSCFATIKTMPEMREKILAATDGKMSYQYLKDNDCMGGVVGMANMVDVVTESKSPWFFGELGFVMTDQKVLPFMPYKGQLGFFDIPYEV